MRHHRLLYLFPEPLPLRKARGVQVVHTVHAFAGQPLDVDLAYVPAEEGTNPFAAYGMHCPDNVHCIPLSRGLPRPFHRLGIHSGGFFFRRLARWLRKAMLRGTAPDAAMIRHVKLAYRLLKDFPQLPVIYEAHEVFADGAPPAKAGRLADIERDVLRRSAVVIAISRQLADRLRERYGLEREIVVVPSATNLPETPGNKDWLHAGQHIVYAGSLYGWKGAQDLVAAACMLPGDRITLIGGDSESVAALRRELPGGGAEVEFLGHLPHPEAMRRLGTACIAVLPNRAGSVSEFTSPLKLFEYMAAGCAIVASDLPVMREILNEDDASWFTPGDPVSLAAAIRRLTVDPEYARRLGQQMRDKASYHTWEARATTLYGIVAALAGRQEEVR